MAFQEELDRVFDGPPPLHTRSLKEDLNGMAATYQPGVVLKRFDAALRDLGLHAALAKAGIVNRLSEDKLRIIFFVKDSNSALRPIASYSLVDLGQPNNMQKALDNLMDLARMEAPGTGEQQRQVIKQQEQQLRQIAKKYAMPDPAEQAQQVQQQGQLPQQALQGPLEFIDRIDQALLG